MPFNKIVATYEAATPVYLGNASPSETATRLREASFKGVLRFWWRAVFWQHFWEKAEHDEKHALALLKKAEGELFGSASDDLGGRQARFYLRTFVEAEGDKNKNPRGVGWNYLLGQGLSRREPAFNAGSIFRVELLFRPGLRDEQEEQLLKALMALGLFGGIGARSRRGVGSICLQELDSHSGFIPINKDDLKRVFKMLGLPAKCGMPPYSAFSKLSTVWIYDTNKSMRNLVDDFGYEFLSYRSYYNVNREKPRLSTPKEHPNFPSDHDEMLKAARGTPPSQAPQRAVFGIPHNYFFKRSVYDKEISRGTEKRLARKLASVEVSLPKDGRRASPFFIHNHIFPNAKEGIIIQALLPSPFHSDELVISSKRLKQPCTIELNIDWDVIRKFSNHLKNNTQLV